VNDCAKATTSGPAISIDRTNDGDTQTDKQQYRQESRWIACLATGASNVLGRPARCQFHISFIFLHHPPRTARLGRGLHVARYCTVISPPGSLLPVRDTSQNAPPLTAKATQQPANYVIVSAIDRESGFYEF